MNDNMADDPDAAMRAMMGFSSFADGGSNKKPKHDHIYQNKQLQKSQGK